MHQAVLEGLKPEFPERLFALTPDWAGFTRPFFFDPQRKRPA